MVGGLSTLVFFGLIVYGVIMITRKVRGSGPTDGPTSVRRLFVYLAGYGLAIAIAWGLTGLIEEAFDRSVAGSSPAFSLALLIVAVPAYSGLARWTRGLLKSTEETESTGWAFYLTATSITALLVSLTAALSIGDELLRGDAPSTDQIAAVVVWGTLWGAHWWLAGRLGYLPKLRLMRLLGSAIGLITGSTGIAMMVSWVITNVSDSAAIASRSAADGLSPLLIGALIWVWYWVRNELHANRTALWEAYVLLLGSAAALLMMIGGAWRSLYLVAEWFLGDPEPTLRAQLIDGGSAAAILVSGTLVWWYHRSVHRGQTERTNIVRLHDYVLAGVGMTVVVAALATLIVAALQVAFGTSIAGDTRTNILLAAVTGLLVATPLWWLYWAGAQRHTSDTVEIASPVRRGYIFALFGVAGVAAIIALIILVFEILEAIFGGELGRGTISSIDSPLGVVLATGAAAWYHWKVYKSDKERMPDIVTHESRTVTVVTSSDLSGFDLPGVTFTALAPEANQEITAEELFALIEGDPTDDLIIVQASTGWEAIALAR